MACGACAKRAAMKNCTWIYTNGKGEQSVYTSEIRALAAKTKDGHQGSIRVECS